MSPLRFISPSTAGDADSKLDNNLPSTKNLDGEDVIIPSGRKVQFLIFVSPDEPIKPRLLECIKSAQKAESTWLEILFIGARGFFERIHREYIETYRLQSFNYILSDDLHRRFRPAVLPFGIVYDIDGEVHEIGEITAPSAIWQVRLLYHPKTWGARQS